MKTLYRCREVRLCEEGGQFLVFVDGQARGAAYTDPGEAFCSFIMALEGVAHRRIMAYKEAKNHAT